MHVIVSGAHSPHVHLMISSCCWQTHRMLMSCYISLLCTMTMVAWSITSPYTHDHHCNNYSNILLVSMYLSLSIYLSIYLSILLSLPHSFFPPFNACSLCGLVLSIWGGYLIGFSYSEYIYMHLVSSHILLWRLVLISFEFILLKLRSTVTYPILKAQESERRT